jgi:hypothetical protein
VARSEFWGWDAPSSLGGTLRVFEGLGFVNTGEQSHFASRVTERYRLDSQNPKAQKPKFKETRAFPGTWLLFGASGHISGW